MIGMYKYIDDEGQEQLGYGFWMPENPNDFFPDTQCCTEEELQKFEELKIKWNEKNTKSVK